MIPDKLNGFATVFRLILPVMVGFMLFMLSDIHDDLSDIRDDINHLSNDYYHEIKDISERLARLETKLEG